MTHLFQYQGITLSKCSHGRMNTRVWECHENDAWKPQGENVENGSILSGSTVLRYKPIQFPA